MATDWEDAPSNDGWEDAPSSQEGFGTKALGVVEGIGSSISGLLSAIPTGIRSLGELAATGGNLDEALQRAESTTKAATYTPKTETGKAVAKGINDTMSGYSKEVADKFAGDVAYLNQQKMNRGGKLTPSDYAAENTEQAIGDVLGNLYVPGIPIPRKGAVKPTVDAETAKVLAEQAKRDAAKANAKNAGWEDAPEGAWGSKNGQVRTPDDLTEEQTAKIQSRAPQAATADPFNQMAQNLSGDVLPTTEPSPAMNTMGRELATADSLPHMLDPNQANADLMMRARDRATAEQQAAMSARQVDPRLRWLDEQKPAAPYQDVLNNMHTTELQDRLTKLNDMQSGIEDINARHANEDLATRIREELDRRGQDPIYVDPQGQAFRGDPNDAGARMGLDRQTNAMDRELTHLQGKETPTGEPLRPLQDHELNAAREEARQNLAAAAEAEPKPMKMKPMNSRGKGGKQRGATTIHGEVYDLVRRGFSAIKRAMDSIQIHDSTARDAVPTMMELYEKTKNPDIISFARDELSKLGYPDSILNVFDQTHQAALTAQAATAPRSNVIPLRQRGAVGDLNPGKKARTVLDDIKDRFNKDNNTIPKDPNPADVVQRALSEGKDSKAINNLEAGSTLAAAKRGSALIDGVSKIVQNAKKRADLNIRNSVLPAERTVKRLATSEVETLANVLKQELIRGEKFDPEALNHLSAKVQTAYTHMRDMFDTAYDKQMEARKANGDPPITKLEYYVSSRWSGDFRRPIFQAILDKNGNPKINPDGTIARKVAWYLAGDSWRDVERQTKALLKEHPDLTFDKTADHVVRFYKRQTDLQSSLPLILDRLGRDDPAIEKIRKIIMEQTVNEAATFLGQQKHFEEKAGIRGFIGDRPGRGGFDEALAMLKQQFQYSKNAHNWSEMQIAAKSLKEIISNPELATQQPNNMKYVKDYIKDNIGWGEHRAMAALEDGLRDIGISPDKVAAGIDSAKSYFVLQKLILNAGYELAQVLQLANVIPHMLLEWQKEGHGLHANPIKGLAIGMPVGTLVALRHMGNTIQGKPAGHLLNFLKEDAWLERAFQYAEDNGVTGRSLVDDSPIQNSFSAVGKGANAATQAIAAVESMTRSLAFMSFASLLKDSKRFTTDAERFQRAEELTNIAMVDYRNGEKSMMFSKAGLIGRALNVLQTYAINFYQQVNYLGRQAVKGNVLPFISFMAMQQLLSGVKGLPYEQDLSKLFSLIRDKVVPTSVYIKMMNNDFMANPELWAAKHFGDDKVWGVLSNRANLALSAKVSAPAITDMVQSPGGAVADVAKQGWFAGKAAVAPVLNGDLPFSNGTLNAQSAMASIPTGLQGVLEQQPFMKGLMWDDAKADPTIPNSNRDPNTYRIYQRPGAIDQHTGVVTRTPQEDQLRMFGLRSQREAVEREVGYNTAQSDQAAHERAQALPAEAYDAIRRNKQDEAKDILKAYVNLTGEGFSQAEWDKLVNREYTTAVERTSMSKSLQSNLVALKNVARMNALMKQVQQEYQEKQGARQ